MGGRGSGCPAPWVKITLGDKTTIPAGSIKPGMTVWTQHETTGEWGVFPVTAVSMCKDQRWRLVTESGQDFVGTFNHRVKTDTGWQELRKLDIGDKLVQPDNTFATVMSIEPYDVDGDVVKITVYDAHTYLSEGFLSHNVKMIETPSDDSPADEDYYDTTPYAKGGSVRTHFQSGGLNDMAESYGVADAIPSIGSREPTPEEARMIQADVAKNKIQDPFINLSRRPEPASMPFDSRGQLDLPAMLAKYQPSQSNYSAEYDAARRTSARESQAFQDMIAKAIAGQDDQGPSQAEKYFRLAAAFGAPTKTGGIGESLGKAAEVLGEYNKEQRTQQRAGQMQALQLGLQGQQAKMTAAKEDLATLRQLTGEEMKDKRTITAELIKDYVASGRPQSTAGKQAIDEGLVQGTAPFQKRVAEISNMNIEKQMAQINSLVAGMTVAQANLALAQGKFDQQKAQASKLTPTEMKLKSGTEDLIANLGQARTDLKQAYALNPNTFDTSIADTAQRKVLEAAGSKDQKLINSRLLDNLIASGAISQLREKFGSQFTQAEGKLWIDLQGIGAKSIEERSKIFLNLYKTLDAKLAKEQKRLSEINQGKYRETSSAEGVE